MATIRMATSYILLGDGDFTYSLDMCRYLAALLPSDSSPSHYDVTCTGVDSSTEVKSKYKDADFILSNIQSINKRPVHIIDNSVQVTSKIVHGVNAVEPTPENSTISLQHFDHVLFHHPHLGIEDAKLHKRFLLHFFHAANYRWMKPNGGLLYLTLVRGQCERWNCISGAERHGLRLLRRSKFRPPPPPLSGDDKTYYQLRRHQCGKSFANRRVMQGETTRGADVDGDSETLVFGRISDYSVESSLDVDVSMLPWEHVEEKDTCQSTHTDEDNIGISNERSSSLSNPYPCNYCTKSFLEQRSLKNHIICSHPDCKEAVAWNQKKKKKKKDKKRKLDGNTCLPEEQSQQQRSNNIGERLICKICECQKKAGEPTRIFPHKQALLDHERAKHSGVHLNIKPDWFKGGEDNCVRVGEQNGNLDSSSAGSCPICDLNFLTDADRIRHEQDFIPDFSSGTEASQTSFKCSYCSKTFREERAKRQHENFCSYAATNTLSTTN